MIAVGIVRNQCKACETWLWKGPKSIVPARRIPVVVETKEQSNNMRQFDGFHPHATRKFLAIDEHYQIDRSY